MEIIIRNAEASDLEELIRWREVVLREVFSIPAKENIDELLASNREYYCTALKNKTHIACFAYMGERIVGCGGVCLYREMPSPDNLTGQCAYLMNIYTIPALRQHGIGKAVVEWLVQEAKHCGAGKIYLETSEKAYPLYKQLEFDDMKGFLKYMK